MLSWWTVQGEINQDGRGHCSEEAIFRQFIEKMSLKASDGK